MMLISRRAAVALICGIVVMSAGVCASAVEMNLAGIKLGSPAATVLKKYSNPTRITVSSTPVSAATMGVPGQDGSMPGGTPGATSGFAGAPSTGGFGPMGAFSNSPGQNTGSPSYSTGQPGSLPGFSGFNPPGMPGAEGLPGQGTFPGVPGTEQQAQPVLFEQEVTWSYDLPDGTTVEFIISGNGRVIQITVGGDQPYALSKTSKGIKLGNNYKDVILKYGYPEYQIHVGRFLRASYADKQRCVFTFLNNKLVGVTIALKPEGEE